MRSRAQRPEIDRIEPPARADRAARVAVTDDLGEEVVGRGAEEDTIDADQQLTLLVGLVIRGLGQDAAKIERHLRRGAQRERLLPSARHAGDRGVVDPAQVHTQRAAAEPAGGDPHAARVAGLVRAAKRVVDVAEAFGPGVEVRFENHARDLEGARHRQRRIEIGVPGLGGGDGAHAGAGHADHGCLDGARARRRECDRQRRRRGRRHGERRVGEPAVGDRAERDGLRGPGDGHGLGHVGRREVVGVTGLRDRDCAAARAGDRQRAGGEHAVAGRTEAHRKSRGRRGRHGERRIAERAAGRRREGDGLAGARHAEGSRDIGRGLVVRVARLGCGHRA